MKILVEVDVFDDPEYCSGCPHITDNETSPYQDEYRTYFECGVFIDENGYLQELKRDDDGDFLKCDQCKKAYQKALNKQP